ncbi:hypothetical protein TSH58p_17435 [Azospirillum sp. TSH58]|uniref:phage tail assembly protein n=1 Tax=Azospirillum sp. TSH58 TaxID=664962 RepID=UPI000D60311C|nr:phage tail assembly protein [Azospirillum sp. TSH58]AWJ85148.1 hypothetical protein TSH58p_17435 [Azospirillum sp. TSH58]PWC80823.1 hypothetical protein TSH58_00840 [Azospirillum sp. TSH58]
MTGRPPSNPFAAAKRNAAPEPLTAPPEQACTLFARKPKLPIEARDQLKLAYAAAHGRFAPGNRVGWILRKGNR